MAESLAPAGVDPDELRRGTSVEMEHTDDPKVARKIALDHLAERSDYYTMLEKVESGSSIHPFWIFLAGAALGMTLSRMPKGV